MDRREIFEYVKKQYGTIPEYLWSSSPDSAVLRHKNGKWYAVVMNVEKSKLGLDGEGTVEIMDVKCEPDMTGMIIQTHGFLPGYHMNKQHWITILLDGTVNKSQILDFLDMSYNLIDRKEKVWKGTSKSTIIDAASASGKGKK
ncbi:MAG: MmcQ/YjbR family DNA-binding protein [Muricoprocola sp.]